MTTDDALLFIDANKYLDLYRTKTGRLSLAGIREQADHIFVTQKVVDEVKRNTIKETVNFLTNHFEELPLVNTNVPDQLFGATEDQSKSIQRQVNEIRQTIKQVNTELRGAILMRESNQRPASAELPRPAAGAIFRSALSPTLEAARLGRALFRPIEGPAKASNAKEGDRNACRDRSYRFALSLLPRDWRGSMVRQWSRVS
jgi:hypothetical protein